MDIKAEIIKDSIGPNGKRITTFVLKYPYWIHQEFLTHRMISRNASSQRAIPTLRLLKQIASDVACPNTFYSNKPGMEGGSPLPYFSNLAAKTVWHLHAYMSILSSYLLHLLGVHKQHANRLLIPASYITVIATATDWDNFFVLRMHPAAQPEINSLAVAMAYEYTTKKSKAQILKEGEWHLPFVDSKEGTKENIIRSVACCARVSYLNHDKSIPSFNDHKRLYDKLLADQPIHASPAEHQAMAISDRYARSGNLTGWIQYRKMILGENITDMDAFWATQRRKKKLDQA